MATLAETVTRICDDLSRPEDEIGDVVEREILNAVRYYESRRFGFNERILTTTISATHSYAFADLILNDTEVSDIIAIDQIKVTYSGREYPLEQVSWERLFAQDSLGISASPPDFWATFNQTLRVYPTPTTDLATQITAHVKLVEITDSVTNAWLVDGEELIRSRASRHVLARKLDDFDKAKFYEGLEGEALRSVMHEAFKRRATGILAPNG